MYIVLVQVLVCRTPVLKWRYVHIESYAYETHGRVYSTRYSTGRLKPSIVAGMSSFPGM